MILSNAQTKRTFSPETVELIDYAVLREAITRFSQMSEWRSARHAFIRSPFAFTHYREKIMTIIGEFSRHAPLWQVGKLLGLIDEEKKNILNTVSAVGLVAAFEGCFANLIERRKGDFEFLIVAETYFGMRLLNKDRSNLEKMYRRKTEK
jgi:hypothetical protein